MLYLGIQREAPKEVYKVLTPEEDTLRSCPSLR